MPTQSWKYFLAAPCTRSAASFLAMASSLRHHHAAVAEPAQILAGEEADAADVADRLSAAGLVFRADGLRAVLDHYAAVRRGPCP